MKHFYFLLFYFCFCSAQAETFSTWIASYSLTGAAAAFDADPDNDGLPNGIEYALDALDPTAPSMGAASLPVLAFVRRTGSSIGDWEWAGAAPPTNGLNGVYHTAITFRPRPGVEGIRYVPQVSDMSSLTRWFAGRSAVRSEMLAGGTVMSVALHQGQRHQRFFMRLKVIQDSNVGDSLSGFAISGSGSLALIVGPLTSTPRAISSSGSSTVTTQDMTVTRTTGATMVTDFVWQWTPSPYNFGDATVTRSSSNAAILTPHSTDSQRWTWAGNGSARLTLTTATASYTTDVTTSTATGASTDTWLSDVSGSLRAHLVSQIDSRLAGKTAAAAIPMWTVRTPSTQSYTRAAGCWGADIDLTPYAAYDSSMPSTEWGGHTLITPRHVLGAAHHFGSGTQTLHFVKSDGTCVVRTITSTAYVPGTDIKIGLLDLDVPAGIAFARVLPTTWATKLPTLATRRVPAARITQLMQLTVTDMWLSGITTHAEPAALARTDWYRAAYSGDSGTPGFLIINGAMVLLNAAYSPGGGSGPFTSAYHDEINTALTSLGGGYQLTDVDLSGFTTF
jgi:hypothetical protein